MINAYSKKKERAQINNLTIYLKELEKEEPAKHEIRRKETTKNKNKGNSD